MNILDLMKRDHEVILHALGRILVTEDVSERRGWFADLVEALERHVAFEEEVFYPQAAAAAPPDVAAWIEADRDEHATALELLHKLEEGLDDMPEWHDGVARLQQLVETHIEDEEAHLFPRVSTHVSAGMLVRMAVEYEKRTALHHAAE